MRRLLPFVPALALACALALAVGTHAPRADERGPVVIDITGGRRDLYKIAVPQLVGDSSTGKTVSDVVSFDLGISGWFKVLDPRSFLANLQAEGVSIAVGDWRNVGAEGVSKGRATVVGDEVALELKLYELAKGDKPVLERSYKGGKTQARSFAHQWSDEVVRYYTGEGGFFSSRR